MDCKFLIHCNIHLYILNIPFIQYKQYKYLDNFDIILNHHYIFL